MSEYKLIRTAGVSVLKNNTAVDDEGFQRKLDEMAAEGWRLISTFQETVQGNTRSLFSVWEREAQSRHA